MTLLRHCLVTLKKDAHMPSCGNKEQALFSWWVQQGYPFIYARQPSTASQPDALQLGLPSYDPVHKSKHRYTYLVSKQDVQALSQLPLLTDIFPIPALKGDASIRVYGSYCFEYLTKRPYVSPSSDVDLLILYQHQSLHTLIQLINQLNNHLRIPIDGEIRFEALGDCSITELLHTTSKALLFKATDQVFLVDRTDIYDRYPSLTCSSAEDCQLFSEGSCQITL